MSGAEPFPIRGHHLHSFADIASWRADPRTLSDVIIEGKLRDRQGDADRQAYAYDVIGDTPEETAQVRDRHRAIFERFVDLEPDDTIVVTTGERDLICQGCIIGRHCEDRGEEMVADTEYGQLQVYKNDLLHMRAIRAFKRLAAKLEKEGKLDPALGAPVVATLPHPTPDAVPIPEADGAMVELPFQAPAGYMKAVLQHWTLAQRLPHFS